jgi:hypothetical protein
MSLGPGNRPSPLRIATNPTSRRAATAAPSKNPRDSMPAISDARCQSEFGEHVENSAEQLSVIKERPNVRITIGNEIRRRSSSTSSLRAIGTTVVLNPDPSRNERQQPSEGDEESGRAKPGDIQDGFGKTLCMSPPLRPAARATTRKRLI